FFLVCPVRVYICCAAHGSGSMTVRFWSSELVPAISRRRASTFVPVSATSLWGLIPDGARLGETVSSLWNKVLQTFLSFVGVCSGAGVGSASSCVGVSVASLSDRLAVVVSH